MSPALILVAAFAAIIFVGLPLVWLDDRTSRREDDL